MEADATPQDRLNWRFQQGLYRAYYDAHVRTRLEHEVRLQDRALQVLEAASALGALEAIDRAAAILEQADSEAPAPHLRARIFELAEALFQSIRMQLSVPRYEAISVSRGANLDQIDEPLNDRRLLERDFARIRALSSEQERLRAIADLVHRLPQP